MHANLLAVALSSALAAAAPSKAARVDPFKSAETWTSSLCRRWAADPKNPWALAHGVGAFGAGFRASDGRLAIDAMVAESVQARGQGIYRFPEYMNRIPVDPHSNHTVATLLGAEVPLMRVFKTRAGPLTLADLVESVRLDFAFQPSDAFWREHAWTIDLLSAVTREDRPTWKNKSGEEIDLNQVLDQAATYLTEQTRFLAEARADGVAMIPKQRQGIWAHPCGGLHLVEGTFAWAGQSPAFRKRHLADIAAQVDLLFYRLDIETRTYEDALDKAPEHALALNVQRLKFYGHWLEVVTHLRSLGLWEMTPARRKGLDKARTALADTVAALQAERAAERMAEFKEMRPQTYLDLIGDSCHASTGLRRSR